MAEGGFNLRQLADIYSDVWREQAREAGVPESFCNLGTGAIRSFVLYVEKLQSEQK